MIIHNYRFCIWHGKKMNQNPQRSKIRRGMLEGVLWDSVGIMNDMSNKETETHATNVCFQDQKMTKRKLHVIQMLKISKP